ncbi:MAG: methyl-accepting chemotaxis protein [Pseudomonadota bacterium]
MVWVENLKLQKKLALILLLPVLSLLGFSAYLLNMQWQKQNQLQRLAEVGKIADVVTGLIHELQLERGRSGSFLQNKGKLFHQELIQQRQQSDLAWDALKRIINNQKKQLKLAALTKVSRKSKQLQALRTQVDLQEIDAKQVVKRYSLLNDALFNELKMLTKNVTDVSIVRFLNAYQNLSQAKELAGLERVRASRILSSPDRFLGVDELLNRLISNQDMLLDLSFKSAPENIQVLLKNIKNLKCAQQFELKRSEFNQQQIQLNKTTVEQWFNLSSCRIEQLRKIELQFMQKIEHKINNLLTTARLHLYWILVLTILPIIPSLWFIFLVSKNVNSVLRWLLNAMQGIAAGNFNTSLPPQTKDELGQLSSGLNQLRMQLATHELEMKQFLLEEQKHNQELSQRTEELQQFVVKVASGDLRPRLQEDNTTTMTQLSHSLNQMVSGLSNLTLQIRGSNITINNMVSELNTSVINQSTGASQQAASVNETVATLEQLRATSSQTLLKAKALGDVAEKARNEGDKGLKSVDQSISEMKMVQAKMDAIAHTILTLNDWIQRIGDITTSVHDMARQLRLLSLNASIEASNAGEVGKGFAVVAVEVKQLAERSQQSTKHVQKILAEIRHATDRAVMATEEGSKGVEQGLKQIQQTGAVVRNLETTVADTSLASRQIVVAINQEVVGIEQISVAIKEIHCITEQFSGTAEQSRYATEKLGELVKHLDDMVNQYQL